MAPPGGPHGPLARDHAERVLGPAGLVAALRKRTWVELWPGVVVPARLAEDPWARAAAALIYGGRDTVLSGFTALAMHGCVTAARDPVDVTVPYDKSVRSRAGLVVHQGWIRESQVVELDGLRTYAVDVAMADVLCTGPQRMALACTEEILAGIGPPDDQQLRAMIAERIARRVDRRGTRRAAALLELASTSPPNDRRTVAEVRT